MKIALDPYMIRHLSLEQLPAAVAALGYDQIELSPRSDFLDWWVMPRATKDRMAGFKAAMKAAGVGLATLQPMYRWASPFEDERQWAMRCWKKAICPLSLKKRLQCAKPYCCRAGHPRAKRRC